MAIQDIAVKKLLTNKSRFADLFNAKVFGGRQVLKSEDLTEVSGESGIIITDKEGKEKGVQRFRDIVMQAAFGVNFAVLACEGQANVHYAMPVRAMLLDALSYTEQLRRLEIIHREKGEKLTGDEFLSRIKKEDCITPVITLVFYYGEKAEWDGHEDLYQMMGLKTNHTRMKELVSYLPNYKINLIHLNDIADLKIFQSDLQYVFGMLKYKSDKEKFDAYIKEHKEELTKLDKDASTAIIMLLGERKRFREMMDKTGRKEGVNMCEAIDGMIEDGKQAGIKEGTYLVAKNMLKKSFSIDVIAETTGLKEEEILALQEEQLC